MTPTNFDRSVARQERSRGRGEGVAASAMAVCTVGTITWLALGTHPAPVLLLFVVISLCVGIATIWSAWADHDSHIRDDSAPCCPFCPPEKRGALTFPVPAAVIMGDGRWAWCGQCGAHYRHADRTWKRPKALFQDDPYREPSLPPACEW